jgi:hypothetical protein
LWYIVDLLVGETPIGHHIATVAMQAVSVPALSGTMHDAHAMTHTNVKAPVVLASEWF